MGYRYSSRHVKGTFETCQGHAPLDQQAQRGWCSAARLPFWSFHLTMVPKWCLQIAGGNLYADVQYSLV